MQNNFGEFIYTLRKEKGWTQAELADRLGITNKAVSKWETGDAFPETAQLVPLATVFDVTVDELLRGKRNENIERENTADEQEPLILKPMTKKQSLTIAAAIGLILMGVTALITLSTNGISYGIYVPILLGCVAAAVFMLVLTGMRRALTSTDLEQSILNKGTKIAVMMCFGISITILSVVPIVALSAAGIEAKVYLPVFFALLVIGVPMIVFSSIQWDYFIKSHNVPTDDMPPMRGKAKNIEDAICGATMLSATAIFLLLGFLKGLWHIAWVVFPVGGILCAIVSTIIRGVYNNKQLK